jgi:hypothetical protein
MGYQLNPLFYGTLLKLYNEDYRVHKCHRCHRCLRCRIYSYQAVTSRFSECYRLEWVHLNEDLISIPSVPSSFAPLNIPAHRRLQTAAVAIWALLLPLCVILFFWLWYVNPVVACLIINLADITTSFAVISYSPSYSSIPFFWPLIGPYLFWISIDQAPIHGGRPSAWARKWRIWRSFAGR